MDSEHVTPILEVDHLTEACQCPVHPQVETLLAELSAAQAEVRQLRMGRPPGLWSSGSSTPPLATPTGWRAVLRLPRTLWWALADSE